MASYLNTAGRRFVPCLGLALSELLPFSDQEASFKRLAKEWSRARDRENERGNKSLPPLRTVSRLCKGESGKH